MSTLFLQFQNSKAICTLGHFESITAAAYGVVYAKITIKYCEEKHSMGHDSVRAMINSNC